MGYKPGLIPLMPKLTAFHPTVRLSKKFEDIVMYYVGVRMAVGFEETARDLPARLLRKPLARRTM